MKKSELQSICNEITSIHLDDLENELPDLIKTFVTNSNTFEENIAAIIKVVSANSIAHSVQVVTDVLVNVGLLQLEDD